MRAARKYARKHGGEFQRWEGQNGMTYASVTTVFSDDFGCTVSTKIFLPTEQNQHCALRNIGDYIDVPEGHADGALQGNITPQDIKVGFGMIGAISSSMNLLSSGALNFSTLVGIIGTANSLDDALSDTKGESFSQQMMPERKDEIGAIKNVITIVSLGADFYGIIKDGEALTVIDASNTSLSLIVDQIKQLSNDENYK